MIVQLAMHQGQPSTDNLDTKAMTPVFKLALAARCQSPYTPLQSTMLGLFHAVMGFYMQPEHHKLRIPDGLVRTMILLRATVAYKSIDRQRNILAAAADYVCYSPAVASFAVQRAIDAAREALRVSWEAEEKVRKINNRVRSPLASSHGEEWRVL